MLRQMQRLNFSGPRRLWAHLLALCLIVLLPLVAGVGTAAFAVRRADRLKMEASMMRTAELLAHIAEARIGQSLPTLVGLAHLPSMRSGSVEDGIALLRRRALEVPGQTGALAMFGPGPDYPLLFHTGAPADTRPPNVVPAAFRAAMDRAAATGQPVLSDLISDEMEGGFLARLVVPVRADGRLLGTLSAAVHSAALAKLLAARSEANTFVLALLDGNGIIVARSIAPADRVGQLGFSRIGNPAGATGVQRRIAPGGSPAILATLTMPSWPGWTMVVWASEAAIMANYATASTLVLAGMGLALLLAAITGYFYSRGMLRSLRRVMLVGASEGGTQQAPPSPLPLVAEFEDIASARRADLQALVLNAQVAEGQKALLRSVLDSVSDAVLVKDSNGRYLMMNARAQGLMGSAAEAAVGRSALELWPVMGKDIDRSDQFVLRRGRPMLASEVVIEHEGASRLFLAIKAPWRDPTTDVPAGVVTVLHDITEERALADRLRRTEERLQHLARRASMSAVADGIAHELNQPLCAATIYLSGAGRLVATRATTDPWLDQVREGMAHASDQILRAGSVLRRMRAFLSDSDAAQRPEPVAEVIAEALDLATVGVLADTAAQVEFLPDAGLGLVMMDRVQVQQVVVNLARNALEAMDALPAGQPRCLRVTVAAAGADLVEVRVADTGPGLAPAMKPHVFEAFRTTKPGGMGIGLSICRTIVEAHGGRIAVEEPDGGGTVFVFTLALDNGAPDADAPILREPLELT